MGTQAGWYSDPTHRFELRYWDGGRWTEHVRSHDVAAIDLINEVDRATGAAGADEALAPRADGSRDPMAGPGHTGESVITSKAANALIEQAEFGTPWVAEIAADAAGVEPRSVDIVLGMFRQRYGGLWVGGRATLTTKAFRFSPNALNRSLHSGSLDIEVALADIERVVVMPGFVTKIMAIHTGNSVLKVRCNGAPKLAEAVERVRGG